MWMVFIMIVGVLSMGTYSATQQNQTLKAKNSALTAKMKDSEINKEKCNSGVCIETTNLQIRQIKVASIVGKKDDENKK